jgi:hypothetical protein
VGAREAALLQKIFAEAVNGIRDIFGRAPGIHDGDTEVKGLQSETHEPGLGDVADLAVRPGDKKEINDEHNYDERRYADLLQRLGHRTTSGV